jgi:hypothetical protein
MGRLLASGLALALAVLAVTTFARTPAAQTVDRVLDACAPGEETIDARALPAAVVTPERCPVAGREIEDGEVGSAVPPPGESVHAEVLTTTGAEELEVGRREDGTIELEFVGEDSEAAGEDFAKADGLGECSDPEYTLGERRLSSALRYRFNRATTPSELRPGDAADAIRRGGTRVANTKSNCRMGDRVPVGLVYEGKTGQGTNMDGLSCGDNDGISVVAFGELPGGVLAATCNWEIRQHRRLGHQDQQTGRPVDDEPPLPIVPGNVRPGGHNDARARSHLRHGPRLRDGAWQPHHEHQHQRRLPDGREIFGTRRRPRPRPEVPLTRTDARFPGWANG